jgi:hypothetical protein
MPKSTSAERGTVRQYLIDQGFRLLPTDHYIDDASFMPHPSEHAY